MIIIMMIMALIWFRRPIFTTLSRGVLYHLLVVVVVFVALFLQTLLYHPLIIVHIDSQAKHLSLTHKRSFTEITETTNGSGIFLSDIGRIFQLICGTVLCWRRSRAAIVATQRHCTVTGSTCRWTGVVVVAGRRIHIRFVDIIIWICLSHFFLSL